MRAKQTSTQVWPPLSVEQLCSSLNHRAKNFLLTHRAKNCLLTPFSIFPPQSEQWKLPTTLELCGLGLFRVLFVCLDFLHVSKFSKDSSNTVLDKKDNIWERSTLQHFRSVTWVNTLWEQKLVSKYSSESYRKMEVGKVTQSSIAGSVTKSNLGMVEWGLKSTF